MTGVLPITLEESRKIVQALLYSGKEYVCVMKLHASEQEERIREILKEFENTIYQRPPLRSSVKRQLRIRQIYYIDFIEMEERNVLFKVGCEGGTYIRKLCYDIGELLGHGAHMQELRRIRAGPFVENENQFVTLHEVAYTFSQWKKNKEDSLLKQFIQPLENTLTLIPKIVIRDSAVDAICHGAALAAPGVLSVETGIRKDSPIVISTLKGEAVALASADVSSDEILTINYGIVAKPKRIIMPMGTYPKCWKNG